MRAVTGNQHCVNISIVIPAKNEAATIGPLLDGLLSQSLPPTEILITDGGSTDETAAIIERYAATYSQIELFREKEALPGRGRNIAAANSACEWLAFIDAGVVPAHDWLQQLVQPVENESDLEVVFGTWEPITDSFFKECAAIAYAYVPNVDDLEGVKQARAIFCSLMRRDVWQKVGGFREDLRSAEDHLFINKVEQLGFKIGYTSKALVRWSMQPSPSATFRRFVTYSSNNLRAGLAEAWQSALLVRYAVLTLLAIDFIQLTRWWPVLVPALFGGFLTLRSMATLWRNRKRFPCGPLRNVFRFVALVPLLGMLDVATMIGTIDWLAKDRLALREKRISPE